MDPIGVPGHPFVSHHVSVDNTKTVIGLFGRILQSLWLARVQVTAASWMIDTEILSIITRHSPLIEVITQIDMAVVLLFGNQSSGVLNSRTNAGVFFDESVQFGEICDQPLAVRMWRLSRLLLVVCLGHKHTRGDVLH